MIQLIARADTLECPLCSMILTKVEHKHKVAVIAVHPSSLCPWSESKFRVHPLTGQAEKIKVAHS